MWMRKVVDIETRAGLVAGLVKIVTRLVRSLVSVYVRPVSG